MKVTIVLDVLEEQPMTPGEVQRMMETWAKNGEGSTHESRHEDSDTNLGFFSYTTRSVEVEQ